MAPEESETTGTFANIRDTTADDNSTVLDRLANGEADAFWDLWEHYKPTLSRRCLQWMGGNRADAEDALSSASLKAWQYLAIHATQIVNVKAWLFRLLYNHCMSMQRANKTYLRYMQPIEDDHSFNTVVANSHDPSFEEAMLRREMQLYLRSRINALPLRLREPAILYFFQEMRQREIASHLNLTDVNVRKRLQHARELLRMEIAPYLRGENGVATYSNDSVSRRT